MFGVESDVRFQRMAPRARWTDVVVPALVALAALSQIIAGADSLSVTAVERMFGWAFVLVFDAVLVVASLVAAVSSLVRPRPLAFLALGMMLSLIGLAALAVRGSSALLAAAVYLALGVTLTDRGAALLVLSRRHVVRRRLGDGP